MLTRWPFFPDYIIIISNSRKELELLHWISAPSPFNPKLIYQYQMLNNNTGKHANMGKEQEGKTQKDDEQKVQSQWVQIVSQVMEKVVSGTN
jgi:hypothetical protein